MSDLMTIEGRARDGRGKSYTRKLRKDGWLPANLIGKGNSTAIEINPKWLGKAYKDGRQFNLDMDGKQTKVKVQELQIHPVKRTPLHVDLMPL